MELGADRVHLIVTQLIGWKSYSHFVLPTGWAWIFILEGLFTIIIGIISYFIIQDFPDTAKFLSETERMYITYFLESLQHAQHAPKASSLYAGYKVT